MPLRVYVAAPFGDALLVRDAHMFLYALGMQPTSTWAQEADGEPEDLAAMPLRVVRRLAQRNDDDLACSDVVLVLPRDGAGREMYAEARIAVALGIPVIWVNGPVCLTAFREGVTRVSTFEEALALLEQMARDRAAA